MTAMVMDVDTTTQSHIKPATQARPPYKVSVHIDTEVLDPEVARRKANVWLLLYAGHLLRADHPELILEDDVLFWRYQIVLTSPKGGDVGAIGQIRLQATTGEVIAPEGLPDELLTNARMLLGYKENQQAHAQPTESTVDDCSVTTG